jgi:hypothetical protein
MPGAQCTRSLAWEVKKPHEHSHHRSTRNIPAFPHAMVLTAYSVLSPVIGFFVTIACGVAFANLTPASRRQDHTTSPSASVPFVRSTISVHRIPPRVRDDREAPHCGTGRRKL